MPVSPTVCSSAATTAGCWPTAHNGTIARNTAPIPAERLREDVRLAYVALTRARRRVTLLAGPLGYTRKSPLPPTSLDWLLRTDDQVDSLEDWYWDVTDRKKDVATCEHGDTLRRFHAACPRVMTVSAPPSPTETVWTDRGHDETSLHARPAPVLDLHAWHLTSFSQLAHGRHDERERRDVVVEPEDAGAIGAVADAMDAAVPLATFARGTHAGNCLHELLEQWDFHEDTAVLVDRGLRRHGSIPPRLWMRCSTHSPR